jgi:hypothetical protein
MRNKPRSHIGEIAHVLPAPVTYLLRKDILTQRLLNPSLQEHNVAGMVAFFGEDDSTTCPRRYHSGGNAVTWSRRDILKSELRPYR